MQPISDEKVVELLPALAEAARADQQTATRFVAPRTGILEETAARRHQFVFGRRGVGKSTLLRKVESLGREGPGDVIFVDIETLRGRPYPDVLIELLIELLGTLESRLTAKNGVFDLSRSRRRARKQLRALTATMRRLLNEPQVAQRVIKEMQSSSRFAGAGAGFDLKYKRVLRGKAHADVEKKSSREEAREAQVLGQRIEVDFNPEAGGTKVEVYGRAGRAIRDMIYVLGRRGHWPENPEDPAWLPESVEDRYSEWDGTDAVERPEEMDRITRRALKKAGRLPE